MGTRRRTGKTRKTHKRLVDWPWKYSLLYVVEAIVLTGIFSFLFYRSVYPMAAVAVVIPVLFYRKKQQYAKRQETLLLTQFCDGMQAVANAMGAGYAVENAWIQGEQETGQLHGKDCAMAKAFAKMNRKIYMHMPMEQVISEFADACGLEDIQNFAAVFTYARRNGGNMKQVIAQTVDHIREKQQVMAEIQVILASKKLEQRIMNVMPPGILAYLTLTSPEYLKTLYHNQLGIILMSVCLVGYLGAFYWSERLVDIRV